MKFFGYVLAFALVLMLSGPLFASAQEWGTAPYNCGAYWSSYPCSYEPFYQNYSYYPYYNNYSSPYYYQYSQYSQYSPYYYPYYEYYRTGYCPNGYYYNSSGNLCYPNNYYSTYYGGYGGYGNYYSPYYGSPFSSYYYPY